ncbi:hypothetical protein PLICRDRAFT_654646 [Plicaturopsis crispa FD-325 SS-3]|nr:hypothetical protein PLICRDRAFT_654646 [Plicaturopsis crispa FD-325 SS-3]
MAPTPFILQTPCRQLSLCAPSDFMFFRHPEGTGRTAHTPTSVWKGLKPVAHPLVSHVWVRTAYPGTSEPPKIRNVHASTENIALRISRDFYSRGRHVFSERDFLTATKRPDACHAVVGLSIPRSLAILFFYLTPGVYPIQYGACKVRRRPGSSNV